MSTSVHPAALVVTDLDGTLLDREHRISAVDRQALVDLGELGVCRVAATGRSLYSLRRVLSLEDPFDFVVFSSGVGILDWPSQALIRSTAIPPAQVEEASAALITSAVSFMVHDPVPENHRFVYHEAAAEPTDFRRRCTLYASYCRELASGERLAREASQFVVIMPPDLRRFGDLARLLAGLSVVRTTSPLDGVSLWMELFAPGTNKSAAAAHLAARLGVAPERTYALGNDFNDEDLLTWAAHACVTANAPAELRARFSVVRAHHAAGFAHAVKRWGLLPG